MPIATPPTADAEMGKLMHEVFYTMLQNSSSVMDARTLWKEIKKSRKLLDARDLRNDFENLDDMANYYSSLGDVLFIWSSEKEYIERIESMLHNSQELLRKMNLKKYKIEQWLHTRLEDFSIFGRFDLFSEYEIIDLKTGKINDSDRNQLLFYSLIFYLNRGIIPTAKLLYLQYGKIKSFRFTHNDIWNMRKDVSHTAKRIMGEEFKATPGEHCIFCPYRALCES